MARNLGLERAPGWLVPSSRSQKVLTRWNKRILDRIVRPPKMVRSPKPRTANDPTPRTASPGPLLHAAVLRTHNLCVAAPRPGRDGVRGQQRVRCAATCGEAGLSRPVGYQNWTLTRKPPVCDHHAASSRPGTQVDGRSGG